MADNSNNLSIVFDKLGFPKDHIEFLLSKLFKYRNDPVIQIVCDIVKENKPHIENFYEVLDEAKIKSPVSKPIEWSGVKPLMFNTPKDPTSLRIYPDILVTEGNKSNLTSLDTNNCISTLKDFIEIYEAGVNNEYGKLKWGDTVKKRLNQYIDMPTAKALTRYANLGLKDDQIRDLAIRIDEYRRPLKLLWADSPEDYTKMYTGGPESCMTPYKYNNFKFLLDMGLCPASMYAFFPHCRGAYIKKNGKTVARAVCYDDGKGKWSYGKIYSASLEYSVKFIRCLREAGVSDGQGGLHNPPSGTKFTFKAFLKKGTDNTYFAPIAYADNMDRTKWSGIFNDETKEFTFEYGSKKPDRIIVSLETRNGHILASHYMTMECDNCGKIMSGVKFTSCKDTSEVFCSDECALQTGYMKVWSGNGIAHYQKEPDDELISVADLPSVKFSTLRAAEDNGMFPLMHEPGILTEEGNIQVARQDNAHQTCVNDASGKVWVISTCSFDIVDKDMLAVSKVPFNVEKHKTVVYDPNANIVKHTKITEGLELPF